MKNAPQWSSSAATVTGVIAVAAIVVISAIWSMADKSLESADSQAVSAQSSMSTAGSPGSATGSGGVRQMPAAPKANPVDSASHDDEPSAGFSGQEQAKLQEIERWEQVTSAFEKEPLDPAWAAETSSRFAADLTQLADENKLAFIDVACRRSRCKAVMEWPSYDEATAGFDKLLHHVYQINCGTETLLPEPGEGQSGQPYQVTVIFDCAPAQMSQ